ncbi:Caspase domain protein [Aquisphaera giovannonii]|uniref:Caspase domain protein n=1 Tax=Aquisphaera giovannonii TaxID=406548 RepID=A0A5B9W9N7_9BACT|nr:caspase family protein [Aquisphaera giovannonii]QEH36550.1 Caspase domain protein [Aquisphaera giovannonii]
MSRLAILIHSENADENSPLPGPRRDIENFTSFLLSPMGGAWDPREFATEPHPTIDRMLELIDRANTVDYTLIVFSGHGGYYGRKMSILLSYGDSMLVDDIYRRIKTKATIVIDACRSTIREDVDLRTPQMAQVLTEGTDQSENYRALFDDSIARSTQRTTVVYGCARGEDAVDTPTGGLFISNLLNAASEWASSRRGDRPQVLTGIDAVFRAEPRMKLSGFGQSPAVDPVSGFGIHPPFAVWLPAAGR